MKVVVTHNNSYQLLQIKQSRIHFCWTTKADDLLALCCGTPQPEHMTSFTSIHYINIREGRKRGGIFMEVKPTGQLLRVERPPSVVRTYEIFSRMRDKGSALVTSSNKTCSPGLILWTTYSVWLHFTNLGKSETGLLCHSKQVSLLRANGSWLYYWSFGLLEMDITLHAERVMRGLVTCEIMSAGSWWFILLCRRPKVHPTKGFRQLIQFYTVVLGGSK